VSVGNIGNTALAITNISFDNLNFSRVPGGSGTGLPPDCATGSQLATGTACNVSIAFTPTTTGPLTGGLTLKDNSLNTEGGMQTIPLSGTATVVHPAAGLQVSPSSLNFGSVPFGSMAFGGFTVTNVDGGTGIVSFALSINGPSYTVSENDCGGTIVPGASCAVYVEYSPITVGVHNDLLTLVTPLPNNPVVSLLGSATGIAPSTSSLPFGPIPFGTTELLLLTIQDVGVPSATFTTSINGPSYKILTTGNTCLSELTAGHSCTLQVEFDPVSAGLHDDTLTVTPSSAAPFTVALTGSASTVAPTVPVLDFGSIPFGTTNLLTLTIKDVGAPGTVTLTSSINGPSYKILTAGNTCLSGLTNGQSCTLPVEFDPVAVGLHNDYLTVTPSAGAVSVVPLLGSASKP
jgi:hypothetical protein